MYFKTFVSEIGRIDDDLFAHKQACHLGDSQLSAHKQGSPVYVKMISKVMGVPPAYIAKIFQGLAHGGIIVFQRGPGDGYLLKKDPRSISLFDVISATADIKNSPLSGRGMGLDECSDRSLRPLHNTWMKATKGIISERRTTTVKGLVNLKQKSRQSRNNRRVLSKRIRAVFE